MFVVSALGLWDVVSLSFASTAALKTLASILRMGGRLGALPSRGPPRSGPDRRAGGVGSRPTGSLASVRDCPGAGRDVYVSGGTGRSARARAARVQRAPLDASAAGHGYALFGQPVDSATGLIGTGGADHAVPDNLPGGRGQRCVYQKASKRGPQRTG